MSRCCEITGNPEGTDTRPLGQPCQCKACRSALVYPCVDCGKMRSQDQGGTTFTVCDECWDKKVKRQKLDNKQPKHKLSLK